MTETQVNFPPSTSTKPSLVWQSLLAALHDEKSWLNSKWGIRYDMLPNDEDQDVWWIAHLSNIVPEKEIGIFLNNFKELYDQEKSYPDLNNDGKINDAELTMVQKYLTGKTDQFTTEKQKRLADVNCDGIISLSDLQILKSYCDDIKNGKIPKDSPEEWLKFRNTKAPYANRSYWNQSMQDLFNVYFDSLGDYLNREKPIYEENEQITEYSGSIPVTSHQAFSSHTIVTDFRISDIANADAGYAFVTEDKITEPEDEKQKVVNPWVRQWYNTDLKSYRNVRDGDKIVSVLSSDEKLQFTTDQKKNQEKAKQWIRLIMPSYRRAVEVEDLNRNFWVIAQVITAISAFLFDENSVLGRILRGLVGEINQLWENVLYLWAGYAAAMQRQRITKVRTVVAYTWNLDKKEGSEENGTVTTHPFMKYDDFGNQSVEEMINYYDKGYFDTNIVLVPIIRENNYESNYFSKVKIPNIYLIDKNKEGDGRVTGLIKSKSSESTPEEPPAAPASISEKDVGIEIDIQDYVEYFCGIKETETKYEGSYPCQEPEEDENTNREQFALAQIKITFEDENGKDIKPTYDNGSINCGNPCIYIRDVAADLLGKTDNVEWKKIYEVKEGAFAGVGEFEERDEEEESEVLSSEITKGYYRGELLSGYPTIIEPYTYYPDTQVIHRYFGKRKKVTVPLKLDGKPMTICSGIVYNGITTLEEVIFPEGITEIQ